MIRFLRYNTRHSLWFPRDGKLPQLNPIMSSSHSKGGKHTFRWDEPAWLFHLRQRLFAFAGQQKCGRRGDSHLGRTKEALPDTWDIGPDGNRTCSYCGSIHFEDLMNICRKTTTDSRYGVERTDKQYKFYVTQPGVRNASEGAIKFYTSHLPSKITLEHDAAFDTAARLTEERQREKWRKLRESAAQ